MWPLMRIFTVIKGFEDLRQLVVFNALSQLTGWYTYQRTKSLSEKTEENACMHIRAHVESNAKASTEMGIQIHLMDTVKYTC